MKTEYRVVWKRIGCRQKAKVYRTLAGANRLVGFLGPEPWLYVRGGSADKLLCCSGLDCACEGVTLREKLLDDQKRKPELEWVRLEQRGVEDWQLSVFAGV